MDAKEKAQRLHAAGSVLARLYLESPDSGLREHLADPGMLDSWPLQDEASRAGIARLRRGPADTKEDLLRDHLYLFTGVGAPLAQPYESPYVTDEGLLFDEHVTLPVRSLYASCGFHIPEVGRYPEDHIGFEIAFVSAGCTMLFGVASDATPGEKEGIRTAVTAMYADHLMAFAPEVIASLRAHASTAVYQALPDLTQGFLEGVRGLLKEVR